MSDVSSRTDLIKTTPVSTHELEQIRAEKRALAAARQTSLVVYFRDGVRVVPLAEGSSLVVGRGHPADVQIRDTSLSRQHACFELDEGRVWVEDLQSTNGTWLGGDRVERVKVEPGAEVMLGGVVVAVQDLGQVESTVSGLGSHDTFQREVELEAQRALAHGRELSLLMVRSERREGGHLSRWLPRVREQLQPFHRVAFYSANTMEALLPETDAAAACAIAERLVPGPDQLLCGVASLSERVRSADALLEAVRAAVQRARPGDAVATTCVTADEAPVVIELGGDGPVLESPRMKKLFTTVDKLAGSAIPVLIQGETGSGKEVVARAIHEGGPREGKPLVPVNCGAIPPQLVEGTLFGHERGAFTGAAQRQKGVFETADGGTVLLDEIGELPAAAQAALLRVLETKRITRVGSSTEVDVDVRILAATHRDLEAMCDKGEFRRDLLYRLDAMAIRIPPLRKRLEDISPLAGRFIAMANEANACEVHGISEAAMALLLRYAWPGNVRELRNAVERAVVIAQDQLIEVDDLPERIRDLAHADASEEDDGVEPAAGEPAGDQSINLKAEVQRYEAELIRKTLDRAEWDRKVTAHRLGLPLRTLSHKMQVYGLVKMARG